jgi:hypothetical protein
LNNHVKQTKNRANRRFWPLLLPHGGLLLKGGLWRIAGILGLLLLASNATIPAPAHGYEVLDVVRVSDLPYEARQTLNLIRKGGPYPYSRDGAVFANREGRLPRAPRGTYREYTVNTPSRRDRGARRIIAASGRRVLVHRGPLPQLPADHRMKTDFSILIETKSSGVFRCHVPLSDRHWNSPHAMECTW